MLEILHRPNSIITLLSLGRWHSPASTNLDQSIDQVMIRPRDLSVNALHLDSHLELTCVTLLCTVLYIAMWIT